jgi:hypothetical protein
MMMIIWHFDRKNYGRNNLQLLVVARSLVNFDGYLADCNQSERKKEMKSPQKKLEGIIDVNLENILEKSLMIEIPKRMFAPWLVQDVLKEYSKKGWIVRTEETPDVLRMFFERNS